MRPIQMMLALTLCMAPMTARARPIVWLHMPDVMTQRVEGADVSLGKEREQVETARYGIVATQGDRADLKARRRDARAERHDARTQLADVRHDLHKARRSGDDKVTVRRTDAYIKALAEFDRTRERVQWHDALLAVNRAELAVARARHAKAVSELEFAQTVMLYRHGDRFVYGPSSYEKQVDRMDRAIEARESDVDIARSVASDTKSEYTASNY